MNDITVVQDILPPNFITALKNIVHSNAPQYKWATNLGWESELIKKSAQVAIFNLNGTTFEPEIIQVYKKYFDISKYNFNINYNLWHNGSYIAFHNDAHVVYSSTIYLNKIWDKNYGGLYLYYADKDTLKAIVPKYNLGIINTQQLHHGTSIISNDAPIRETIQLFISDKNRKSNLSIEAQEKLLDIEAQEKFKDGGFIHDQSN